MNNENNFIFIYIQKRHFKADVEKLILKLLTKTLRYHDDSKYFTKDTDNREQVVVAI